MQIETSHVLQHYINTKIKHFEKESIVDLSGEVRYHHFEHDHTRNDV